MQSRPLMNEESWVTKWQGLEFPIGPFYWCDQTQTK